MQSCLFQLLCIALKMIQIHRSQLYLFALACRSLTCIAAKYNDIQKGIAHQTVSSVDTAYRLACYQQIRDYLGKALAADLQTAVLIMKVG